MQSQKAVSFHLIVGRNATCGFDPSLKHDLSGAKKLLGGLERRSVGGSRRRYGIGQRNCAIKIEGRLKGHPRPFSLRKARESDRFS